MATLTIDYTDRRDLVRKLRSALIEQEEWITPKELRMRFNVESGAMTQRLKRWAAAGVIELEARRGPTGRILMMKVTPELRAKMNALRGT